MMEKLTLKDLAVDHDYYCSESNYSNMEAALDYDNFDEFLEEFEDADVDMNLVFRWDLKLNDNEKQYYMQIFQMKQRKGIYTSIMIHCFTEKDIPKFVDYIKPHIDKLKNIWKPFNF